MKYDVLFLHPPRFNNDNFLYPVFPVGMMPLADILDKQGYSVKIVNLSMEQLLNPKKSIKELLKQFEFDIIAIDLHFWANSYDSIELSKLCKEINPNCKTILGGFTSSFFASSAIIILVNKYINYLSIIFLRLHQVHEQILQGYCSKHHGNLK